MDRPAQEPPEPAAAADSPLSFPVEAPKLAGVEPGAGAPAHSPAEDAAPRPPGPLAFPAEATPALPLADPPLFPGESAAALPPADPSLFPAEPTAALPPVEPLAFPAEAAAPRQPGPLAFPAEATPAPPLADSPLFPSEPTTAAPLPAPQPQSLPFPVAELPGVAAVPGPAPAAEPEPEPAEDRTPAAAWLLRFGPAVLAGSAALLAVAACFLPLFGMFQELDIRQGSADARLTITETAWGTRIEVSGQEVNDRPGAPVGIPVIIAAAVLAVAAFTAVSRPGRGLTRWLLSAGAVFAAGVVTTIGMNRFELAAIAGEEVNVEVTTGPGMWLLVLATVQAAVAAVLTHLPLRKPGWADPAVAYADTPTPPSGIAITVLPPDDDHP